MQERKYFKGNFVQILVVSTVVGIAEYFEPQQKNFEKAFDQYTSSE